MYMGICELTISGICSDIHVNSLSMWIHFIDENNVDPDQLYHQKSADLLQFLTCHFDTHCVLCFTHKLIATNLDFYSDGTLLCLLVVTFVIADSHNPLQTAWIQIRPDKMSGLIWIQDV